MKKVFQKHSLRRAFSLIELVFVIVIIAIISTLMLQRTDSNSLQLATSQVISHLRYTKHLAMVNNKFDAYSSDWMQTRWQLKFFQTVESDNQWAYAVYDDSYGVHSGNPNETEIARDPLTNLLISGGYQPISYGDERLYNKANLGNSYNISNISFGCGQKIGFDYMGRPLQGDFSDDTTSYDSGILLSSRCEITISDDTESKTICIEPETGYIHQCD
ncbi:MAG: prepilin-type N-terminal cleavage/methylation domain-containing protein [Helicobacteraceae bacterium]|nr:prepilin-type N-terminal cleavage/methylation domain-containing protein [Helicobacteraceae bacterium]